MSFPSGRGPEDVLAEVDRVQARGGTRVLDMLLVARDSAGAFVQVSLGDDEDFGELVAQLLPIGGARERNVGAVDELWVQAQSLPAHTSVVFLLIEHHWAEGIFEAIEDEGVGVLGAPFLTPEGTVPVHREIMAWEDAARSIAEAQAAEVDARLRIVEARDAAGQAVTDSDRIRSEAAAVALRALTNAGLVEAAAAHEALEALEAAGLLIAAADEAADVAVAAAITPAELRVLRYLPTKLTFALIADKLGISRGAAKNRAERAYKKLGVHTRADAVTRAHTLRILP
jgi:DNA-binding CsgD family transcriptional regulator